MFAVFSRAEPKLEPLRALLFGLTIAAPVGPIALLLVHIGLNHRLRAGLLAALGVAAADLTYAVVALTAGAALAAALSAHRLALQDSLRCCCSLWDMARAEGPARLSTDWAAREAGARHGATASADPGKSAHDRAVRRLRRQLHASGIAEIALDSATLFAGSLAVQAPYAGFGAALQRWLDNARAVRILNVASGAGIAIFGLYGLARTPG